MKKTQHIPSIFILIFAALLLLVHSFSAVEAANNKEASSLVKNVDHHNTKEVENKNDDDFLKELLSYNYQYGTQNGQFQQAGNRGGGRFFSSPSFSTNNHHQQYSSPYGNNYQNDYWRKWMKSHQHDQYWRRWLTRHRGRMTCRYFPGMCHVRGSPGPDCCKSQCVNVKTDRHNCGACGRRCKYNEVCCGGKCVNTMFDRSHCGRCNNKCKRKGDRCFYGMCSYA